MPTAENPPSWGKQSGRGASAGVTKRTDLQTAAPETEQQIFNLVQGLYCRGWVIDCRRQGFNGDIYEQPYRVFGILFKSTLTTEINRISQNCFRDWGDSSANLENWSRFQDRITNRDSQLNYGPGFCGDMY
jgi:hypothetical protein